MLVSTEATTAAAAAFHLIALSSSTIPTLWHPSPTLPLSQSGRNQLSYLRDAALRFEPPHNTCGNSMLTSEKKTRSAIEKFGISRLARHRTVSFLMLNAMNCLLPVGARTPAHAIQCCEGTAKRMVRTTSAMSGTHHSSSGADHTRSAQPGQRSPVRLRQATPDDLEILMDWYTKPHIQEQAVGEDGPMDFATELPREVGWREMLMAEVDGKPIGFVCIIDPREEETHYWGDVAAGLRAIDIWIGEEAFLGQGCGSEMMAEALVRCFASPAVQAVLVDPLLDNERAIRFYMRLGFQLLAERNFDGDDCAVLQLSRGVWETAQQRRA